MLGFKFNAWEVISEPYKILRNFSKGNRYVTYVDCKCKCGSIRRLEISLVKYKRRKSCGCERSTKANNGLKHCKICNETKTINNFNISNDAIDGLRHICKLCLKKRNLKTKYNLDFTEYEKLLSKQNYTCACCKTADPNSGSIKRKNSYFTVDHCHKTGKIRGLLCFRCNVAIGNLGDTANDILKAYNYLQNFENGE